MRHFYFKTDSNHFASFQMAAPVARIVLDKYYHDGSLAHTWKPVDVINVTRQDFPADNYPVGDFPGFSNFSQIPLCSVKAWTILSEIAQRNTEALPLVGDCGTPLRLLNVMETIEAIDLGKSEFSVNTVTGRINKITKCVLRKDLIQGKDMFKTPLQSGADLFVSERFRDLVEKHKLEGLVWKEVQ